MREHLQDFRHNEGKNPKSESGIILRSKKDLRIVQKDIQGQYTLWEVSPKVKFTIGTQFDRTLPESTNAQMKGTLEELVGGSFRMYLLAGREQDKPYICFISDQPSQSFEDIRTNIHKAANATTIPFIQDKELGLLFIPSSSQAKEGFKTSMHVGPSLEAHKDLAIFPLCIRQLVGKAATLKSTSEFYNLTENLKYGDIGTIDKQVFMSFLSRGMKPELFNLLSQLGIYTMDTIPRHEKTPVMDQWFKAVHKIDPDSGNFFYNHTSDLLAEAIYMHELKRKLEIREDPPIRKDLIGVTSGVLDGDSVAIDPKTQIPFLVSPRNGGKTEYYNAVIENYTPETGVIAPKAVLLYRDSQEQERYMLTIGAYHPEVREYVKLLDSEKRFVEIAELDGKLFFHPPKISKRSHTSVLKYVEPMSMTIEITKIQDGLIKADRDLVLKALNQLKKNEKSEIVVCVSELLEKER